MGGGNLRNVRRQGADVCFGSLDARQEFLVGEDCRLTLVHRRLRSVGGASLCKGLSAGLTSLGVVVVVV